MKEIHVLGFAGSLRRGSYNRILLNIAQEIAPDGTRVNIFDLASVPLFNADVEAKGFPAGVAAFRDAITEADALLIASPEYNKGVSGILSNALDWASRKAGNPHSPLFDKPVAVMGASTSGFGTARAQREFWGVATGLGMHVYNGGAQVYVSNADEKFSPQGECTDPEIRQAISALLEGLQDWTRRLSQVS